MVVLSKEKRLHTFSVRIQTSSWKRITTYSDPTEIGLHDVDACCKVTQVTQPPCSALQRKIKVVAMSDVLKFFVSWTMVSSPLDEPRAAWPWLLSRSDEPANILSTIFMRNYCHLSMLI